MPYYVQAARLEIEIEKKASDVIGWLCAEKLKVESAVASTKKQRLVDAVPSIV